MWGECQQVTIFIDTKSDLEAQAGDKLLDLTRKLKKLSQCHRVALQWIPAYCRILGNEMTNQIAKENASETQYENSGTLNGKKSLLNATLPPAFPRQTNATTHRRDGPNQHITGLRTRHCRLKRHLYKIKIESSPSCACGKGKTPHNVLQSCPLYEETRKQYGHALSTKKPNSMTKRT